MMFGRVPLPQARGGILAHSLKTPGGLLRKGTRLDAAACRLLEAAGYTEVTVARLEPGDIPEGEAARRLGALLPGPGLRRSADAQGRVNLFAETHGLLRADAAKIERLNRTHELVALATLADRTPVVRGDMVATLKIIPFAVSGAVMEAVKTVIAQGAPALSVKPFRRLAAGLILKAAAIQRLHAPPDDRGHSDAGRGARRRDAAPVGNPP